MVLVFLLSLLFVAAVALSVVAAFALPHLRAGSPLLTEKGERLTRRAGRRLRPLTRALGGIWPRVRPLLRWVRPAVAPAARLARRVARPVLRAVGPRVAPITQAISRAVEEGVPAPAAPRRPAADEAEPGFEVLSAASALPAPARPAGQVAGPGPASAGTPASSAAPSLAGR